MIHVGENPNTMVYRVKLKLDADLGGLDNGG
jgi:hypothetical protein